jgi:hypothetical protein
MECKSLLLLDRYHLSGAVFDSSTEVAAVPVVLRIPVEESKVTLSCELTVTHVGFLSRLPNSKTRWR